jgi:chorismate-pyruvate lyase
MSLSPSTTQAISPILYPLDDFYARSKLPLPRIERITGDEVPEPYHSLLVHDRDMTPTLEKFHGSNIHLEILNRQERGDFYFREVVLWLDDTPRPVEFGANKVNLALFPPRARQYILEERLPLGRILKECEIQHMTTAKAFLRVHSDELITRVLRLAEPCVLYGRRAAILDSQKRPLSEVVEILPLAAAV